MLEWQGVGMKSAVAHQLCPQEDGTQDGFGNWTSIIAEFGLKHRITTDMCAGL